MDWFARVLAAIGLLVGAFNFLFAVWKTKRDRRISIEDDFWFRKVLTPATIEPMLNVFVELSEGIPGRSALAETRREYALKVTTEFAKLYSAIQTLSLFDGVLPELVTQKLSLAEDLLTEYSATLAQEDASYVPSIADLRRELWAELNAALFVIKEQHMKK